MDQPGTRGSRHPQPWASLRRRLLPVGLAGLLGLLGGRLLPMRGEAAGVRDARLTDALALGAGVVAAAALVAAALGVAKRRSFLLEVATARAREEEARIEGAQQRAEARLRESEEKFATAFWLSPLPKAIFTVADGRMSEVNNAFLRTFGFARAEVVGRTAAELGLWAPSSPTAAVAAALFAGREAQEQPLTLQTKDGAPRDMLAWTTTLRLAGAEHLYFAAIDVTERNRLVTTLAKRQATLRGFFDALPGLAWVKDMDGRYLACNPGFEALYGAPEEAIVGKTDFDFVPPELASFFRERDAQAAVAGRPVVNDEWVTFASDGRRALLETVKLPVHDALGEPFGVLGISQDVTARRGMEAERERLVAELKSINVELEQFAYVASHDLKAPLRGIDQLAGFLREDLEPVLTDDSRRHLDQMQQRVRRMERLLEDLLAYSRAGRVDAQVRPVDLPAMLRELVELIGPPPGFEVHLAESVPPFDAAVTPLRTVLLNLVNNAIKHHDQGRGRIEVRARAAGRHVEFTVADDGPGIPEEYHERIWGMFQTLRPRDQVEGSGIGLALVKRIVTRYHGTATVERREPRGSLFRFTWPREPSAPEQRPN